MKSKLLRDETEGERSWVLAYQTGDTVIEELTAFVKDHQLKSGCFTAIGALKEATLYFYDWESKGYKTIPIAEQVEVLSLIGNIGTKGDKHKIHAHITLGRSDGSVRGGHLKEARVRPTLELFLHEGAKSLPRTKDEKTGLDLIDL